MASFRVALSTLGCIDRTIPQEVIRHRPLPPANLDKSVRDLIPHELRAPLPRSLRAPQAVSERHLIAYVDMLDSLTGDQWAEGAALSIVGYGLNVP